MIKERNKFDSSINWPIAIFIILVSCVFIFPPEYLLAKQISKYAIHWMFICLGLGVIFMFLNLEKLLYTAFICCGILASFLLYSYNTSINHALNKNDESITVEFINPSLSTVIYDSTLSLLKRRNTDIIILEEMTPEWNRLLDTLKEIYPYSVIMNRVDPFGKAIFSKFKLESIDTITLFSNPIILANINLKNNKKMYITVVNSLPAVTMTDFKRLNNLLNQLSKVLLSLNSSLILAANLNIVPWAKEMREFKLETKLNSSRRDNSDGSFKNNLWDIFNIPKNEIFYSEDLECSDFDEITDSNLNPIGLFARYQFKKQSNIKEN